MERRRRRPSVVHMAIALYAAGPLVLAGCGQRFTYNKPPTVVGSDGLHSLQPDSRVVVVGAFDNPVRSPVNWNDIGPGMAEALSHALLNDGEFDVWSNQRLAVAVERVLEGPTESRKQLLAGLYEKHPEIRFVITGKVTDFHHAGELPKDVRRWSIAGGRREAIAAIQFTMVDMQAHRVLVADHVYGTGRTSFLSKARRTYDDIAFGSYLFWNSPLGRASEEAIREAMERIHEVVPTTVEPLRVVRLLGPRKIGLEGGSSRQLKKGQEFFVCQYRGDELRAVLDPHTEKPLRARILTRTSSTATAWLMGEMPGGVELLGAELRWDPPTPPVAAGGSDASG